MDSHHNTSDRSVTTFLIMVFIIICLLIFLFLQTQGGLYSPFPYRHLALFSGRVIDADTGRPVSEAVVLAVYYLTRSSVAGQNDYIVDGRETMTDKNGEFALPEKKKWFRLQRGYPKARLIIFKPGYGVFPNHARSEAVGVNKTWPPEGKPIVFKLPRLTSIEERKKNIITTRKYNFPLFIKKMNEELVFVGLNPVAIPSQER